MLDERGASLHRPATTEIEQPPLAEDACLEVAVHAVVPSAGPLRVEVVEPGAAVGRAELQECGRAHALRVHLGDELHVYARSIYGRGAEAHEQTLAMFGAAESLLHEAGMGFADVVRTWIHLRDIDRDYAALNRARREFFDARAIHPAPASTGIGGGPLPPSRDLCIGLYAVRGAGGSTAPARTVMTTPTLNEAALYGSDFARGMRVDERNKRALHVSGTASLDEAGRTLHRDDFDGQVDRMLLNVAKLLEGQGAGFDDVVSGITYLKRPEDARRLRAKLADAGFDGFPNALVLAPVCRPELLCETEVLAVLPSGVAPTEAA